MKFDYFIFIFVKIKIMYYLYEHLTLDGIPFYIGKGTKTLGRSYGGYQRAYSRSNRTLEWKEISKSGYIVKILEESNDLNYILEKEDLLWSNSKTYINKQNNKRYKNYILKKINNNTGILYIFNKTYIITKEGNVFNFKGDRLKLSKHSNNYIILTVSEGKNKRKNFYVHRLVAELFLNNPNNLLIVNHKNLNREDNNFKNLEWCSQIDNIRHSVNLGSYTFKNKIKKILQFDEFGNFIKEWDRAKTVANYYACSEELIQQACQQKNINKVKKAKKFIWIYKEDYEACRREKFNSTIKL